MSTVYLRGRTYYVGVPIAPGQWLKRSTGTSHRKTADAMARMIDELGHRGRRWGEFLQAIATDRLTVAELYDAHIAGKLDDLKSRMEDLDIEPYVEQWLGSMRSSNAKDTIEHYRLYVGSLVKKGERFPGPR